MSHSSHGNRRRRTQKDVNAAAASISGQYHGPPSQTFMSTKPFHSQLVGGKDSAYVTVSPKMKPMVYKPMP